MGHGMAWVELAGHRDPAGQMNCSDGVGHTLPSAHGVSTVVPTGQCDPCAQSTWLEGVVHTDPRAHGSGADDAGRQKVVLGHSVGWMDPEGQ